MIRRKLAVYLYEAAKYNNLISWEQDLYSNHHVPAQFKSDLKVQLLYHNLKITHDDLSKADDSEDVLLRHQFIILLELSKK